MRRALFVRFNRIANAVVRRLGVRRFRGLNESFDFDAYQAKVSLRIAVVAMSPLTA